MRVNFYNFHTEYLTQKMGKRIKFSWNDTFQIYLQVEVKPYVLDDQLCDECQGARCGGKFAPFFCANVTCLQVKSKFHYDFLNVCYTVLKLRTY